MNSWSGLVLPEWASAGAERRTSSSSGSPSIQQEEEEAAHGGGPDSGHHPPVGEGHTVQEDLHISGQLYLSIFDPIGMLPPLTIILKVMLKRMFKKE